MSSPFNQLGLIRDRFSGTHPIFPNLSYPIVTALDRGDLDALYEAQQRHTPAYLGDNATKDFILRHVFEIEPGLIRRPSDLLRVLLRRHYREQRIPASLDERFVGVLRKQGSFDDWPLETIIPEREAFFAFLQERWPVFLDQLANQDGTGVHEKEKVYGFELPGPADLPFDHDDVRIYVDNLFLEGLLQAVPHEQAESWSKSWLLIGIRTDDQADRTRRVEGLLDALESNIPKEDARHEDWFHFARNWAELVALVPDPDTTLPEPAQRKMETLQAQIDAAFVPWLAKRYAGLINLPPVPPVMLHHIPRHLARHVNEVGGRKAALVLIDGLATSGSSYARNLSNNVRGSDFVKTRFSPGYRQSPPFHDKLPLQENHPSTFRTVSIPRTRNPLCGRSFGRTKGCHSRRLPTSRDWETVP